MDLDGVHDYQRATMRHQLHDTDASVRLIAGGTALFGAPLPGSTRLVSLRSMSWPALESHDGELVIAATCSIRELARGCVDGGVSFRHLVHRCVDALAAAPGVHSRATVGGNICGASPAAAMVAFGAATDATALIWQPDGGQRRVSVIDLVVAPGVTTLQPGEVLRSVRVSAEALRATYEVRRVSLTPDARTAALVIATRWTDPPGRCTVSVTGAVATPQVVQLEPSAAPAMAAAEVAAWPDEVWLHDTDGSAPWRRAVTCAFVRDAVARLQDGDG
ncbi:hypothetical protein BVC93_28970 [Mycobacterium sp. MS1601]|uniref:FAD binding domain-containing protein n=1 Tax=Mycobacterium sp. MS1601 TaxID=1936029 RepID=UPI0009794E7C|nr:FAD binding domain-containing protein [Mycobacterium sp. MS1601]AQA05734.1 hypothetical protein BVC93_28970 [Mycobacterium sp. MS1601]